MLQNYLKIAWRSLLKQRFFAVINIVGLAIGVACCTLISLFVWNELSYDRFHEKADRIYRVDADINFGNKQSKYAVAQAPLAAALLEEVPEVEAACRFRQWGSRLLRREGTIENVLEERIVWADNAIFDVFTLPLVAGEKSALLTAPNTIAISETAARRHFGDINPVGQNLVLDNETALKVTGVFRDIPLASHFHYDFFLSMESLEESKNPIWLSHNFNTYLVAKPGHSRREIEEKIAAMFRKYAGPQLKMVMGVTIEELESQGNWARYSLMPLRDIHLKSDLIAEHETNSDMAYVWIFGAIALFILVIACINFMNLATARSAGRAKEVGMRKVLGSEKQQLVGQFLAEAVLMSLFAFVLAMLLAQLAMPFFNQLTGKELVLPLFNPVTLGLLGAGVLVVGFLAGSYPAFYLSSFGPLEAFKGKLQQHAGSGWLRHSLVVFQFVVSTALMVGTLVIYSQLNFIQNKRLGFEKEQVLILRGAGNLDEQFEGFKNNLETMPEVRAVTATCYLPVNSCRNDNTVWVEGKSRDQHSVSMQNWSVDDQYMDTYRIEMADGRFFSKEFSTDSAAVVLNERAVELFGFDQPLGQRIARFTDANFEEYAVFTVIGVVKNFHYESLRGEIGPLGFFYVPKQHSNLSVRFDATAQVGSFIEKIRGSWAALSPGLPFEYDFLDDRFARMYSSEQRLGQIFIVFAGLAIFIACLGMFALSAYTAERRMKEIGIRKVLGASLAGIVAMLSKDFLKPVLIAIAIAIPLAYFSMGKWLQDFAYRIDLEWYLFAGAGLAAIVIATVTIAFQSIKAALANPVESLKNE